MFNVDVESREVSMVTENGAGVAWSPSGGELAVSSYMRQLGDSQDWNSCRVVTLDADGKLPQREVAQGIGALWSPTGEIIAFYRRSTKSIVGTDLFTITVDEGSEHKLADSGVLSAFSSQWSPDGTRILANGPDEGIKIIEVASGKISLVGRGSSADWSPDGNWIVFGSTHCESQRCVDELYITRADGEGKPKFLANGAGPDWSQQ